MRDDSSDVGNEPNVQSALLYLSDDIWVRRVADPNYDPHPFPSASPTWTPLAHEGPCYRDPKSSSPNYMYVRIRNRGSTASTGNETLHVYWAKASTGLGWPGDWNDHLESPSCGGPAKLYGYEVTKPRKNAATASAQEKADYVSAIQTIDAAPYTFPGGLTYFDKQNQVHVFVFSGGANEIHQTLKFFPWHREFIGRYEALLREVKPTLTLLYWDWTTDPSPTLIGGAGYMGASSGVIGAPFAGFGISRNKFGGAPVTYDMGLGAAYQSGTTLPSANFNNFWQNVENPSHGNAHCYINGTLCSGNAAKDPVFFMIHANADRLWALWQRQNVNRWTPSQAYDASQAAAAITAALRPWDGTGSISPWTVADGYIISKTPTHHSIVYPPTYEDALLKIPVLQAGQCCIIEIPFYPPPLTECAGFSEPQHLCLLARIQTSSTAPYGMTFAEGATLWQNVKNNNNIAWRNTTLGDFTSGPFFTLAPGRLGAAAELIRNFRDQPARITLRYDAPRTAFRSLFDYGYVRLRLDPILYNAWAQGGYQGTGVERDPVGTNEVRVLGTGATMANLALNPRQYGRMDVALELNRNYQPPNGDTYHLDITQYDDQGGQEPVGGQGYDLDFNWLSLLKKGSDWKYYDAPQNLPADWALPTYDDRSWRTGSAPFGYNRPDASTPLYGTNNQAPTAYFRQYFDVADPTFYQNLALNLVLDDGLVVYLNGQEAVRLNMPTTGAITRDTRALLPVTGAAARACRTIVLSNILARLQPGRNLLAAELHPAANTGGQGDLGFDLELAANIPTFPYQRPAVVIVSPENGSLVRLGGNVPVQADVYDPDGDLKVVRLYHDGAVIAQLTAPPYTALLQGPNGGTHRVSVEAEDNFGHLTRMESVYNVLSNLIPVCVMTQPTNSAVYAFGTPVPLVAQPSDADGTIVQVLFHVMSMEAFNGPHQIVGIRTAPPYQVNANNLAPGYYVALAQATDDRGASGYSAAMEFRVSPPAGTPELRFRYQTLPGGRVLTLEWDDPIAVLEHAPKLPGNWGPVPDASSPYPVEPGMMSEYFRLRLR